MEGDRTDKDEWECPNWDLGSRKMFRRTLTPTRKLSAFDKLRVSVVGP